MKNASFYYSKHDSSKKRKYWGGLRLLSTTVYSNDLPAPGEQAGLPNEEKIKIIFASGNNIIPLHPPPNAFATNYGAHATVNRIQAPRLSKRKKCRRG